MATSIRTAPRSAVALLAGMALIVVLSIATDFVAAVVGLNPSAETPAQQDWRYLLPLGYRCLFAVAGSYLAARLAPAAPMTHALALGAVGALFAVAGLVVAIRDDINPLWYPAALVLATIPCAWAGGVSHRLTENGKSHAE
jgi:hypothetical protein